MRFNKTQLSEATEKARKRGFSDGRKVARRRGYIGFLFGLLAGVGGVFGYINYEQEIHQQFNILMGNAPAKEYFTETDISDAEWMAELDWIDDPTTQPVRISNINGR